MEEDKIYDHIVIGSGFGGSVSAMRLTEKGYDVLVLEKGHRYEAEDFPKNNWKFKKYLWLPKIKMFGIQRIDFFKSVVILSGVGVGGGSLVYANTHMMPPEKFYDNKAWAHLNKDWKSTLAPYYKLAKFMLGSTKYTKEFPEDKVLEEVAIEMGREESYKPVDAVGVYFGDTEEKRDPFFNGLGPERLGCTECAGCMVGCQHLAKNTLDKNYLFLAEKLGLQVRTETEVTAIRPDEDGFVVHTA
ncbi:MAG: GMC family oxidoreductase N-terminal domain-containing protein, partial [Flavobacteriales bacterium]|nr:GMC family oxidoreductase N-terminal domain-containing protein [Flavobacteriales bacterium]